MLSTRAAVFFTLLATAFCSSGGFVKIGPYTFDVSDCFGYNQNLCLPEIIQIAAGVSVPDQTGPRLKADITLPEGVPRMSEMVDRVGAAVAVGVLEGLNQGPHRQGLSKYFDKLNSEIKSAIKTASYGYGRLHQGSIYHAAIKILKMAELSYSDSRTIQEVIKNVVPPIIIERAKTCTKEDDKCTEKLEKLMYDLGSRLNLNGHLGSLGTLDEHQNLAALSVRAAFEEVLKKKGLKSDIRLLSPDDEQFKYGLAEAVRITQDKHLKYQREYGVPTIRINESSSASDILEAWNKFGIWVSAKECADVADGIITAFGHEKMFGKEENFSLETIPDPNPQSDLDKTIPGATQPEPEPEPVNTGTQTNVNAIERPETVPDKQTKKKPSKSRFKVKSPVAVLGLAIIAVAVLAAAIALPIYFGR